MSRDLNMRVETARPHRKRISSASKRTARHSPAKELPWQDPVSFTALLIGLMVGLDEIRAGGLERYESLFTASNVLRLILISGILGSVIWRSIKFDRQAIDAGSIILLAFFSIGILSTLANTADSSAVTIKQIYSVFEWLVAILSCSQMLNTPRSRSFDECIPVLLKFCRIVPLVTVLVVLAAIPFSPSLAFGLGPEIRLGGSMVAPNKLAMLCAIGAAAWLIDKPGMRSVMLTGLFVVCAIWSGSRSGQVATFAAVAYGAMNKTPPSLRKAIYAVAAALMFAIVLSAYGYYEQQLSFLTRSPTEWLGLNNRGYVWAASWRMIDLKPMLGWGWYEGPAQIGARIGQGWWFARNAQNDALNFAVANGLFAGIVCLLLYAHTIIVGLATEWQPRARAVLIIGIILLIHSLVEPNASTRLTSVGMIWALLVLVVFRFRLVPPRTASTRRAGRPPTRLVRGNLRAHSVSPIGRAPGD